MALDADRDGYVSALDVSKFLQKRFVDTKNITMDEIITWFSQFTDTPQRGLDCTQFAQFLHYVPPRIICQDVTFKYQYAERVTDEQLTNIRGYFVKHMAALGVNKRQYYNVVSGGKGMVYDQMLRAIVEQAEGRQLLDEEWKMIYSHIKTNKYVTNVTREELFDFMSGKLEEIIIEEEDLSMPPRSSSQKQNDGSLRAYGPNTPEFMTFATHKPKPETNGKSKIDTKEDKSSDDERPVTTTSMRLKIENNPISMPTREKMQSTSVTGPVQILFSLISEKIQQMAVQRRAFQKFDLNKTGKIPIQQFSAQLLQLFGLNISAEKVSQVLEFALNKQVQFVDYEAFQVFYDPGPVLSRTGRNVNQSSALQNERRTILFEQKVPTEQQNQLQKQIDNEFEAKINKEFPTTQPKQDMKTTRKPDELFTSGQIAYATQQDLQSIITTDAESNLNKNKKETAQNFISHVKKMIKARGIPFQQFVREVFPGKKVISNRELIWFFRNKIGCSYSAQVIIGVVANQDGFIQVEELARTFE
ncbi:Conserved_hypothetical protein [Hexamita inflata]|uniref:EF-hand domain-containing protein n=1 Tax=Hexamita inflata TaxID=28002 RepID=A0AA86PX71_9EUKA|nr:Conserved hypothetical protein [Hexamita inflata]